MSITHPQCQLNNDSTKTKTYYFAVTNILFPPKPQNISTWWIYPSFWVLTCFMFNKNTCLSINSFKWGFFQQVVQQSVIASVFGTRSRRFEAESQDVWEEGATWKGVGDVFFFLMSWLVSTNQPPLPFFLSDFHHIPLKITLDSPPKFNRAPEKVPGPKRKFIFQPFIFRGYFNMGVSKNNGTPKSSIKK